VDCDILAQSFNKIDRVLIPPRYTLFSGSSTTKNSWNKRACSREISGWVTNREVFLGTHK
jgi:hypothetical protein